MSQSNETTAPKISMSDADPCTAASATDGVTRNTAVARASTKDAGRVHIGGGMMLYHTTKDAGRVHVGGGMMRF